MTKPLPATLKIRMSEQLREAIEEAAERNSCSLNTEIVRRLADSFVQVTPDVLGAYQQIALALSDLLDLQSNVIALVKDVQNKEQAMARVIQTAQDFTPLQHKLAAAMTTLMPRPGKGGHR
jgi:hypothetical protein